jgi:hypothetical protein
MHGNLDYQDIKQRLKDNFTATEILNMLSHEELNRIYGEAATLMEWEEEED